MFARSIYIIDKNASDLCGDLLIPITFNALVNQKRMYFTVPIQIIHIKKEQEEINVTALRMLH